MNVSRKRQKCSQLAPDFKKKRKKVGKGKQPAENATNVTFKSRAVFVPTQMEQAETDEPTTHRKLSLQVSILCVYSCTCAYCILFMLCVLVYICMVYVFVCVYICMCLCVCVRAYVCVFILAWECMCVCKNCCVSYVHVAHSHPHLILLVGSLCAYHPLQAIRSQRCTKRTS